MSLGENVTKAEKDVEIMRLERELAEAKAALSGRTVSCVCGKEQEVAEAKAVSLKLIDERDEALAQWHAHQKNVPCAGCVGGHDTYWKTVIESPQWVEWEKSCPQWDVDECRECGHISQGHFQAFLAFTIARAALSKEKA